jgi:FHA domain
MSMMTDPPASGPRPAAQGPATVPAPPEPEGSRGVSLAALTCQITEALGADARPLVDSATMARVYAEARSLRASEPLARVQGYRLVRALDRNVAWCDIPAEGDGYAVLGSHNACDLVLSNDAGVWLRHLAAICVRLADDRVGLRLIDLKTDMPFFLDDDTPRWSVLARGPFAMRIGRHIVCGFPTGEGPVARTEPVACGPVLRLGPSGSTTSSPNPLLRLTIRDGSMGASVELASEALDTGLLIGRGLNCFDGGLRRVLGDSISRAHVLLLRDQGDILAFDLCSGNGTRAAGQRVRRQRLSDAGPTLELGKMVTLSLLRLPSEGAS